MGKRRRKRSKSKLKVAKRRPPEQRILATQLPRETLEEWYDFLGRELLAETRRIFAAPWAGTFTDRLPPVLDIEHGQAGS